MLIALEEHTNDLGRIRAYNPNLVIIIIHRCGIGTISDTLIYTLKRVIAVKHATIVTKSATLKRSAEIRRLNSVFYY